MEDTRGRNKSYHRYIWLEDKNNWRIVITDDKYQKIEDSDGFETHKLANIYGVTFCQMIVPQKKESEQTEEEKVAMRAKKKAGKFKSKK